MSLRVRRSRPIKLVAAAVTAAAACSFLAPAALAAGPPPNDTAAAAIAVIKGYTAVVDTTGATTDADDTQLNASCGAPATDASVWYTYQGDGSGVLVDTNGSDYSSGISVGVGTPGNLETVACGPTAVGFLAEVGTTYYIQVFDDQLDLAGTGGSLHIAVADTPPPPGVDVTINPKGTFSSKTGTATISGTYSCTNAEFIDLFLQARQRVGRGFVDGFGEVFAVATCDGTVHPWSAEIFPDGGKFAGGKSITVSVGFACGVVECGLGFTEQVVQLNGKK